MLDSEPSDTSTDTPAATGGEPTAPAAPRTRKRAPRKATAPSGPPVVAPEPTDAAATNDAGPAPAQAPAKGPAKGPAKASAKAPAKKSPGRKAAAKKAGPVADAPADVEPAPAAPAALAVPPRAAAKVRVSALAKELDRTSKQVLAALAELGHEIKSASASLSDEVAEQVRVHLNADVAAEPAAVPGVLFQAPTAEPAPRRRRKATAPSGPPAPEGSDAPEAADVDLTVAESAEDGTADPEDVREAASEEATGARRRRRRGRRGRGGANRQNADGESDDTTEADETTEPSDDDTEAAAEGDGDGTSGGTRRRRRRRRSGGGSSDGSDGSDDDPPNTVTHVREPAKNEPKKKQKNANDADDDGVRGVKGSTRLEARRQRRRDGRDTNRRRPPILSEAEFLARREAVDRVMAVRQNGDRTQIAVLEDDVLVEHYVTRASAQSYVGNVYLGRVQNVLPSMEAAFVDIGKGRNGVLYAGEVNWDAAGLEGKSRAIENALKSGDSVLVQVTKDPFGHKGARLTSQISLPGRFLVYVPGGGMTGISRRLPDTERHRLKSILKKIVPEDAGVIVRTAAEGATEEELTRDVERLQAEWETISEKAAHPKNAPSLVHGEPDLAIRVVRDVFNEDFKKLLVEGDEAWRTVSEYVEGVAPDLRERVSRHTAGTDLFHDLRVDEGLAKALDRKVWLPSGGSLVIDRTEAMTVIDVNTGKFVGSGGNLEQTVTRNNLEAAEEIVRQLRLRDVGGIVVIDFIDMVLESNRDLVLRRLTECLGRDRTKHQVAEVTSLGLVQMTRKRVGEGLLEAFSETCEHCHGRGVILHSEPVDQSSHGGDDENGNGSGRPRRRRGKKSADAAEATDPATDVSSTQREKALAAMTAIHRAAHPELDVEIAGSIADLELDAVESVLSGSAIDPELLDASLASASEVTSEAAVEPEPEPEPEVEPQPEPEPEPEPEPVTSGATFAVPDGVDGAAVAADGTPARRPRRRRAASRPAGPPAAG